MYNIKLIIKNNKSIMEIITRTYTLVEISVEDISNAFKSLQNQIM